MRKTTRTFVANPRSRSNQPPRGLPAVSFLGRMESQHAGVGIGFRKSRAVQCKVQFGTSIYESRLRRRSRLCIAAGAKGFLSQPKPSRGGCGCSRDAAPSRAIASQIGALAADSGALGVVTDRTRPRPFVIAAIERRLIVEVYTILHHEIVPLVLPENRTCMRQPIPAESLQVANGSTSSGSLPTSITELARVRFPSGHDLMQATI